MISLKLFFMFEHILFYLGFAFTFFGFLFSLNVFVRLVKSSNAYTMLHTLSVMDAIGTALFMIGVALLYLSDAMYMISFKVLGLILLVYLMNPISSYVLAKVLFFYENESLDRN